MTVLDELEGELRALVSLLGDVSDGQWSYQTRCTGWDVGALVAHMTIGMQRVAEFIDFAPETNIDRSLVVDAHGYYRTLSSRSAAANEHRFNEAIERRVPHPIQGLALMSAASAGLCRLCRRPDRPLHIATRWGAPMRLEEFLKTRLVECVIHGLDLTDALSAPPIASPTALSHVAELLCRVAEITLRRSDDPLAIAEMLSGRRPADKTLQGRLSPGGRFPALS